MSESQHVEYKQQVTPELEKEVVAFLNSNEGGVIYVGSASEPMPTRQIEFLFAKRIRHSIGKIKSPKSGLKFEQLHIYYQSAGKVLNEQFAPNLELLNEDGDMNL